MGVRGRWQGCGARWVAGGRSAWTGCACSGRWCVGAWRGRKTERWPQPAARRPPPTPTRSSSTTTPHPSQAHTSTAVLQSCHAGLRLGGNALHNPCIGAAHTHAHTHAPLPLSPFQAIIAGAKEASKAEAESVEGGGPTVTEADIANIVSQWTGIPIEKVSGWAWLRGRVFGGTRQDTCTLTSVLEACMPVCPASLTGGQMPSIQTHAHALLPPTLRPVPFRCLPTRLSG